MKLLTRIKHIAQGFKNYIFEDEQVERIAKERTAICAACPHITKYEFYRLIGHYGCSLCTCAISTLVRSLDHACEDNPKRWEAVKLPTKAVQDIPKEQPKR